MNAMRFAGFMLSRAYLFVSMVTLAYSALFVFGRVVADPLEALGPNATPAQREEIRRQIRLDDPLPVRYVSFMRESLSGEFGVSLLTNRPAADLVDEASGRSLGLFSVGFLLAVSLGTPLAVVAGLSNGGFPATLVRVLLGLVQSAPAFAVGLVLVYFLGFRTKALPISGSGGWAHVVLPGVTLALCLLPSVVRSGRAAASAWAWEGGEGRRTLRAIGAAISVVVLEIGAAVGALVVIEAAFAWPGVFHRLISAIAARDVNVVTAAAAMPIVPLALLTFGSSMVRGLADPRASLFAQFVNDYRTLDPPVAERTGKSLLRMLAIGLAVFLVVAVLVLAAGASLAADPVATNIRDRLAAPSQTHPLGTDALGRDLASRALYGLRATLMAATIPIFLAMVTGGIAGGVAGLLGRLGFGWLAAPVVWFLAPFRCIPLLVWWLLLVSARGPSEEPATTLLLTLWLTAPFFAFAGGLIDGTGGARLAETQNRRFWWGRSVAEYFGAAFIQLASLILVLESVAFLGFGSPPPAPSLGSALAQGARTLEVAPWTLLLGLVVGAASFAFTVLGDSLSNILAVKRSF